MCTFVTEIHAGPFFIKLCHWNGIKLNEEIASLPKTDTDYIATLTAFTSFLLPFFYVQRHHSNGLSLNLSET